MQGNQRLLSTAMEGHNTVDLGYLSNLEIFNVHNRPLELLELTPTNFAHRHTP
jgi:hypothetical protein